MSQRPTSSNEQFSASTSTGTPGTTGATQPINTSTSGSMSSTGQGTIDQAKQQASELTEQAKDQAGQLADQAKQQVSSRLTTQKDRAAESLSGVAQALRQTGANLREQDQSGMTQYVEQAADQVERLSGYIQNRELPQLMDEVERFARRQPTLFLGGAFVLGLIGARFLKSSSSSSTAGNYPIVPRDQYSRGTYTTYGTSTYGRDVTGTTAPYASTMGDTLGTSVGSTNYGTPSGTARTGLVGANTSDVGTSTTSSSTTGSGSLGGTPTTGSGSLGGGSYSGSSTTTGTGTGTSTLGSTGSSRERGGREGQ